MKFITKALLAFSFSALALSSCNDDPHFSPPSRTEVLMSGKWKLDSLSTSESNFIPNQTLERKISSRMHPSQGKWIDSLKVFEDYKLIAAHGINKIVEEKNNSIIYEIDEGSFMSLGLLYSEDNKKILQVKGPYNQVSELKASKTSKFFIPIP